LVNSIIQKFARHFPQFFWWKLNLREYKSIHFAERSGLSCLETEKKFW
jgi:hypothetical protein